MKEGTVSTFGSTVRIDADDDSSYNDGDATGNLVTNNLVTGGVILGGVIPGSVIPGNLVPGSVVTGKLVTGNVGTSSGTVGSGGTKSEDEAGLSEFSASEIRKLLQALFPHRRLVLSQFTFFNQVGVSRPTGQTYRRGRRCYRLQDILPIACILALKEEGIPFKNIESVPGVLQTHAEKIFRIGGGVRLSGFGANVELCFPGEEQLAEPYLDFLSGDFGMQLFWSFDVGMLATQLEAIAAEYYNGSLDAATIRAA